MLKYESVADDIRKKIAAGEYGPNDQLPTTPELCDLYDVSKITIKKAMDELVQQGLIARRRGSGTYVKRVPQPEAQSPSGWDMSSQMAGFCADHPGVKVTSDVHEFSVVRPKPEVAELLGMDPDEFTYYVCRTRLIDDVPQVIEYTFMPIKLIPDLRERNVEHDLRLHRGRPRSEDRQRAPHPAGGASQQERGGLARRDAHDPASGGGAGGLPGRRRAVRVLHHAPRARLRVPLRFHPLDADARVGRMPARTARGKGGREEPPT